MKERPAGPGMAALMSDAELVTRVLGGDRDAYQFLVQRHQEAMFRVAYALVLDDDVAADIVQDAFVRAYVNLARCRDRSRFRVWLLATLRNRGLDYLKEVIIEDSLGLAEELEAQMQLVVDRYECEWANALADPEKLKRFRTFVNDQRGDPDIHFVKERGQPRPARASELHLIPVTQEASS